MKIKEPFNAISHAVGAVLAIIGMTLTSFSTGNIQNFVNPLWPESFGWETILAVGAALRYSFFAFSGWEGATYMAEEVKNPQKKKDNKR